MLYDSLDYYKNYLQYRYEELDYVKAPDEPCVVGLSSYDWEYGGDAPTFESYVVLPREG